MRKIYCLMMVFCAATFKLAAQTPFNTTDSIDINNIAASVLVHGDMWWNPALGTGECKFPKGTGRSVSNAGAVWMSGYDAGNNLHVAAQTYKQAGNDYWPGPLDISGSLSYATSALWAHIWKINRTDISAFHSHLIHTTYNTPLSILSWPGKGNVYATVNGGAPLTVSGDMAPFMDLNHSGIYEPLLGEYPDFKGDQALWWVFSDNDPGHTTTHGMPLGVEVHVMAYAYKRNRMIDNVIYYDFNIINKSGNNYHNFRWAIWDDIELYGYFENFISFDSSRRMCIGYNPSNDDWLNGHPSNSDKKGPLAGLTLISLPGDFGYTYVPAGSFTYYDNDQSFKGIPFTDTEYNNYMRSKFRYGRHITNDFAGPGIPSHGSGSGPDCNYVFTGDPADSTQWSECSSNNNPGERRIILSSNDFYLNAGSNQHIVMGLVVIDTNVGGCGRITLDSIKNLADTAWHIFRYPLRPFNGADSNSVTQSTDSSLVIYPNPAHDVLYIKNNTANANEESIRIYNAIGQYINTPISKTGNINEVNISSFARGIYFVKYSTCTLHKTVKFLKE